ncbi:MAG: cobalt ECF transporter T component CbiQ [Veillonellaceae bacterium]|jgi:cobalt/nickel transport system permease protein|nr:cobalt ECF transporter T component CbiQ [Veillonellaceae bacterium]
MLYLDYLAYNNALKHVSIHEKILLGWGCLILSLVLPRPFTLLCIILLMHSVMLYAKISPRYLLRLWMAPLAFLLVGLVTVAVSFGTMPFSAIASTKVGSYYLGITAQGIMTAKGLFLRSAAAVSCLFMVATTTPIAHITAFAARIKALNTVMEISLLTYRFIFVFLETAAQIYTAQQSRLGYSSTKRSLRSLTMLAANLCSKSFITARDLYTALLARNYSDKLVYRYPRQDISLIRLIAIVAVLISVALTATL